MRALRIAIVSAVFCSPAVFGVDRQFSDIVRAISDEFGARPMRIPLFGLVNAVTFVVRPAGTSHIDLAVFEHLDRRNRTGRDLEDIVQRAVGRGWAPFVQVHSRRNGKEELVLVYMRPEGRDCRLLVTAIEPEEATVVQLKLNPEGVRRWIQAPGESARSSHAMRGSYVDE